MAARTTKKSPAKKAKKGTDVKRLSKLPGFFSFANKKFVLLALFLVGFAAFGSYKMYYSSAQTAKSSNTIYKCTHDKYDPSPYLYKGVPNQTSCVRAVQAFLNNDRAIKYGDSNAGWPYLTVDGAYGNQTAQAVAAFQISEQRKGHEVNGSVTKDTWGAISTECISYGTQHWLRFHCGIPSNVN